MYLQSHESRLAEAVRGHPSGAHPSVQDLRTAEDKRQHTIQQEHILRQQMMKSQDPHVRQTLKALEQGVPVTQASLYQAYAQHLKAQSCTVPATTSQSSSIASYSGVKHEQSEASFNLYGYQPFQHTYISPDKLYSQGIKEEKSIVPKEEPRPAHMGSSHLSTQHHRGHITSPPPLIKDSHGKGGSVIVEHKSKEHVHAHHPLAMMAAVQQGSITLGSPRHHQKGMDGRPGSNTSPNTHASMSPHTMAPGIPAHMAAGKLSRTQSPLRVASPQQLSAAVMQPMELQKANVVAQHPQKGVSNNPSPGRLHPEAHRVNTTGASSMSSPSPHAPAIAQPPVSLPRPYSHALIQQGLVPNPMYSHNSSKLPNSPPGGAAPPRVAIPTGNTQPSMTSPHAGQKRRSPKEPAVSATATIEAARKRLKTGVNHMMGSITAGTPTIPVTTQPMATNPHPHTVPSSHLVTTSNTSPTSTTAATANSRAGTITAPSTGFMDSFRSFVENTVHNAFYHDAELNKHPKGRLKAGVPPQSLPTSAPAAMSPVNTNTTTMSSSPYPPHASPIVSSPSSLSSSASIASSQSSQPITMNSVVRPGPANTPGGASVSSTSSIMETINRVANGIDTDSDTLSAPSPPPHIRSESNASPCGKSMNHTKFKKAWLQRYSDEDKRANTPTAESEVKPEVKDEPVRQATPVPVAPVEPEPMNTQDNTVDSAAGINNADSKPEAVKDCYVNCSYITPTKEGGAKSPISSLSVKEQNQNKEQAGDNSTSSASEAESQVSQHQIIYHFLLLLLFFFVVFLYHHNYYIIMGNSTFKRTFQSHLDPDEIQTQKKRSLIGVYLILVFFGGPQSVFYNKSYIMYLKKKLKKKKKSSCTKLF